MARHLEWFLLAALVIILFIFSALARTFVRMAPLHDDASKALTAWLETIERLALAATALIGIVLGCFALLLKRSGRTLTTEYADVDGASKIDADESKPYTSADVQLVQVWLIDADNVRALLGWPPTDAFRARVLRWLGPQPATLAILAADRRGERPSASRVAPRLVLTLPGGPRCKKADDSITRDLEWWLGQRRAARVTVVTSDRLLRRRCRDVAHTLGAARLRFEGSDAFAYSLPEAATVVRMPGDADASDALLDDFIEWVEAEEPGPTKSEWEFKHAGERARRR